jgi:hypothetical protein
MKCKYLTNSGSNLVKVEQTKKPVTIAERASDGVYSFSDVTAPGKSKNVIDKKTNPKCVCSAQNKSGFMCPKIGSRKEGGLRKEHGSVWRVTPICSTIQKL